MFCPGCSVSSVPSVEKTPSADSEYVVVSSENDKEIILSHRMLKPSLLFKAVMLLPLKPLFRADVHSGVCIGHQQTVLLSCNRDS